MAELPEILTSAGGHILRALSSAYIIISDIMN
jgi:hypothetical protein